MPISWQVANGVVFLESGEDATFPEWRQAIEGFLAHPGYRPGMGVIHDWRRLLKAPATPDIIARSSYVKGIPPLKGTRWAFVVGSLAAFGVARMAQILTEESSLELRVFRDMAQAEAWVREDV
jgi:hypothetical protein